MAKTQIMGVLNVTPDSFFDGGLYDVPEAACAHAARLCEEGADWIDIGAESSRPGAAPVGPEEELRRLLPVLERLPELAAQLSVDTYRAETARQALARGVRMVNDISALRADPDMAGVVAEAGCPCVLMHMLGTPQTMQQAPRYGDVVSEICAFFEERMRYAMAAGIAESQLWLDPGFGFGKTPAHNLELLRRLPEFRRFGRPVLIGTSNKSTIEAVLHTGSAVRTEGTAATVAVAAWLGADMVRVHDVRFMAAVARMTDAIREGVSIA